MRQRICVFRGGRITKYCHIEIAAQAAVHLVSPTRACSSIIGAEFFPTGEENCER